MPENVFQSAREMLEAWWQATEAAGVEPAPPPATVEGMDIVFEDERPITAEVAEVMMETLASPVPDMDEPLPTDIEELRPHPKV